MQTPRTYRCPVCGHDGPRDDFQLTRQDGRRRRVCHACHAARALTPGDPRCPACAGLPHRVRGIQCRRCGLRYQPDRYQVESLRHSPIAAFEAEA